LMIIINESSLTSHFVIAETVYFPPSGAKSLALTCSNRRMRIIPALQSCSHPTSYPTATVYYVTSSAKSLVLACSNRRMVIIEALQSCSHPTSYLTTTVYYFTSGI
jgi:hypothetical protein